jgi:hypothetical protein
MDVYRQNLFVDIIETISLVVLLQNESHVSAQKMTNIRRYIRPSILRQWQTKPIEKSV